MGFWNKVKRYTLSTRFRAAENRAEKTAIYAQVVDELEQGVKDKGLWGKALVDSAGDESKAKARYLELRAFDVANRQKLTKDLLDSADEARQDEDEPYEIRVIGGKYYTLGRFFKTHKKALAYAKKLNRAN